MATVGVILFMSGWSGRRFPWYLWTAVAVDIFIALPRMIDAGVHYYHWVV